MDIPVTRTKIILPRRRSDLLSRVRLSDLMVDLLDNKLIILAAPAGYGKTSLLIDVAHQTDLPFCWFAIDPLDRDFFRFVTYLIASINQRFPAFGQQSSNVLQRLSASRPVIDQLVTTMVNEAYDTIHEHFAVVLDDYHLVDDQPEINQFLGQFVQGVDENCHIVVASRTLLSLPDLPLMVARSQVGGLSFEDLAFRSEEVRSLFQQNYELSLSETAANEIIEQTEGWITGLLLSTQAKSHGMHDRSRTSRASAVGLYDYLAQQVLDQQTPTVREFLLRSSVLEEFDADLCAAIFGPPTPGAESWSELMEVILRANLFVLPISEKGLWLRYHHLFRDFLQSRLAIENPDERKRIQLRLADIYAQKGEWERAHEMYQRLGNTQNLLLLVEQAGSSLIKAGRLTTLSAWVDDLPPERLADHPILLSLRGSAAVMLGQVERGLALLNHAVIALESTGDPAERLITLVRRSHAFRFLGNLPAALKDAEDALALSQGHDDLRYQRAEALRAKGIILYNLGQPGEAIQCLQDAESLYDMLGLDESVALIRIDLGSILRVQGQYRESLYAYENALTYLKKAGDLPRQASVMNNLGVLHHSLADFEKAASYFEQAVTCAAQSGYTRIEAITLASIGDLYCDLDAPDAAQTAYQRGFEIASRIHDRFLKFYLTLSQGIAARKLGDDGKAFEWLDLANEMAVDSGSAYERGLCHQEAGWQALQRADPARAADFFDKAHHEFQTAQQRAEQIKALLCVALAHWVAGNKRKALTALENVYPHINLVDINQGIVSTAREAKELIEQALSSEHLAQTSRGLLARIDKLEIIIPTIRRRLRRQVSTVPFAPPKLTVRTLGKILVQVDDPSIPSPQWQSQTARDLLLLLLAHPDGLTKEAVSAIFWPDNPPNQVKMLFKNTIYRMRHALGVDAVSLNGEHYTFNHALDYEYDAEVFVNKVAQAETASPLDKQISAYKSALHLYRGVYLPELEGTWVQNERLRLARIYQNSTFRLAELYLQAGDYHHCLELSQDVLGKDPCIEEAHRLAMRAHHGLGNKADVVRQYEHCERTLSRELKLPPSTQTSQLYEQLTR